MTSRSEDRKCVKTGMAVLHCPSRTSARSRIQSNVDLGSIQINPVVCEALRPNAAAERKGNRRFTDIGRDWHNVLTGRYVDLCRRASASLCTNGASERSANEQNLEERLTPPFKSTLVIMHDKPNSWVLRPRKKMGTTDISNKTLI